MVDVEALGKFNDNYKYIISVIHVFSNFYIWSMMSKGVKAVALSFLSIFEESRRRRPVWVRTDTGKEF